MCQHLSSSPEVPLHVACILWYHHVVTDLVFGYLKSAMCNAGLNWRKLAPVPILALVTEYCELPDEQVVVLFQILAAEINFGYKFQTVK